ncbi:hypothetical protein WKN59_000578 [Escherichia coli]|uniref:Protein YacM n=11 Tax=Enterobacteriaceae TaxID=543 RepID=YACM_ECOLI|nr:MULTISPECIES: protein YacM [Gammaproteobacteria]YP_009518737.1 protein YacM [Escherichia coli str. K-12 substr. MG1655]P0DPM6.1 RecName: Full=Protein YacM [Escherichia coli K-12]EHQ5434722.1 hypothetical protein [Escherichia coli O168]EHQ5527130.1 hypothetical protein [Escherichia coli O2]EHT2175807.1 hypothetical protein [Escherichia coli O116]EHW0745076.1 hypothetical protein [Escherichia coli O48]EHY1577433.1 hypothetical protein [Escherichia coli O8]EHY1703105.1 hypothetical protein 
MIIKTLKMSARKRN